MAQGLIPAFASGNQADRLDLFRLWLEKGKDFSKVEVEVKRRNIQAHTAKAKDLCMSRAQLEADPRYKGKPQDIDDLIKRKTASGQFIDDPNFPGREDLRQYIINSETSKEDSNTRQNIQQINSVTGVSTTEALSLTEDGCDFSAANPTILGLTGAGHGTSTNPADTTSQANTKGGDGNPKNRRRKGRGKGGKGETGENGQDGDEKAKGEQPDKPLTPLAKAVALKARVFLTTIFIYFPHFVHLTTSTI